MQMGLLDSFVCMCIRKPTLWLLCPDSVSYIVQWFCSVVSSHLVYQVRTPDMFRPKQLVEFHN